MTPQRSTPRCSGGVSRRREDRGARYLEAVALGSCDDQSPFVLLLFFSNSQSACTREKAKRPSVNRNRSLSSS
jgi:hypothetical protein